MRFLLLLLFLSIGTGAMAAPVTYALSDFNFADGGSAHGSFTYDSSSNIMSAVNIYTTSGTAFTGDAYGTGVANWLYLEFYTDNFPGTTNETAFVLSLNQGAISGTAQGTEFLCTGEWCSGSSIGLRSIVGSGTLTAVPLPAAVWLFGSALAGLGWIRRKQSA